jgi:hypothetical protein
MDLQSHYMTTRKLSSLRTAVDNEVTLDKDATPYSDIFDAFRLAMKFYLFSKNSEQQGHSSSFVFTQKSRVVIKQ